ncbi:MAG TPA: antibiotic biosynthesis monooxygenase [Anaerolineae bacterium]|nr:antibiotic biosynthesis monooxygenase [Anaerolineae bacterium]
MSKAISAFQTQRNPANRRFGLWSGLFAAAILLTAWQPGEAAEKKEKENRSKAMIIRTIALDVLPEHRDEMVKAMMTWSKIARQTPGCLTHSFYADLSAPNTIRFYGEWENEESWRATVDNPGHADLMEVIKETGATVKQGSKRTAIPASEDNHQ